MELGKETCAYSYREYQKEFLDIYRDERLEFYYYDFLKNFLKGFCEEGKKKVVGVHANRYANEEGSKIHKRALYAEKNGMPDLIIVPGSYCYEGTTPPYVCVEIKRPEVKTDGKTHSITGYQAIKYKAGNVLDSQLETEFRKTNFIIYTDCITWHLLRKTRGGGNGASGEGIKSLTRRLLSKTGGSENGCVQEEEICLAAGREEGWAWAGDSEWDGLKKELREFIEGSEMKPASEGSGNAADT